MNGFAIWAAIGVFVWAVMQVEIRCAGDPPLPMDGWYVLLCLLVVLGWPVASVLFAHALLHKRKRRGDLQR